MGRKPTGRPVGPPEKPINWDQFEQLCALQCTQSEIASLFHVDVDTIRARVKKQYGDDYSAIYKRYSEGGLCSLRRNQFVLSKKNTTMAIWLGKIWLGQRDNQIEEFKYEVENVRAAIRELQEDRRREAAIRSALENEQSLLDQRQGREQNQVSPKLGAETIMAGRASLQNYSESAPARNNDIFLP